jgi:hypothetical protein
MKTGKLALTFAENHTLLTVVAAVLAVVIAVLVVRAGRRLVRGRHAEDVLTFVAASVATSVVMNGMWRFAGRVLHFSGAERIGLFAFLELAMLTAALRARRNVRESAARSETACRNGDRPEPVTAGADGAAVWVLSALSAVLSSLDASSTAEVAARLAAPLVAAWLWERGLSLYRRRLTGHQRAIHWRITPERVLVRLGLAEPTGRAVGEVAAQRRLARLALAAKRLRELQETGSRPWRQRWAARRLDAAMARAVEDAGLASDPDRQRALLAQMGALYGARELATLTPPVPWHKQPEPVPVQVQESAPRAQAAETAPASASAPASVLTLTPGVHPKRTQTQVRDRTSAADPVAEFAAELAAGVLPSVREIRRRMHVGQDRAKDVILPALRQHQAARGHSHAVAR